MARIYGPADTRDRGSTVAFDLFVQATYRDRVVGSDGLAPREGC